MIDVLGTRDDIVTAGPEDLRYVFVRITGGNPVELCVERA